MPTSICHKIMCQGVFSQLKSHIKNKALHFAEVGVTILHLDIDALLWLWLEQMGKPGLTCDVTTNTADIVDNAYLYYITEKAGRVAVHRTRPAISLLSCL